MKQDTFSITNCAIAEKAHRNHVATHYEDDDILYFEQAEGLLADLHMPMDAHLESNLFAYVEQGSATATFNGREVKADSQHGIICPANTMVSDISVGAGCELHLLCISNGLLLSMLRGKVDAWYRAVYLNHIHTLDFTSSTSMQATAFYKDLLHFRTRHLEYNYSREVIKLLLQTIVTDTCSMLSMQTGSSESNHSASEQIFAQFVALLSSTEVKHRPVEYYADRLCISAKHLAKVCHQQSGHSAAYWITEAVKEDIRHALADPQQSNKEIAGRLGFGSPSFFGRYVRQQFGRTPTELRGRQNNQTA